MNNDQSHGSESVHSLTGAYVVDALDDRERAVFETHLAECADCREEVASLGEATDLLSHTTELAPPAFLRDELLAQVSAIRPLPPQAPEPGAEPVTSLAERRRRRWPVLVAAAAAVLVIGGGVVAWHPWADQPSQVVSATDQVLNARDAQRVTVDLPDGARATLVRSVAQGRAVLVTRAMPSAPSGKTYQVWLQHGDDMVPAGLMGSSHDQTLLLDGNAADASAAGITVEPTGGSPAPTSAPIALFPFPKAAPA